jgi:hypothetical protein
MMSISCGSEDQYATLVLLISNGPDDPLHPRSLISSTLSDILPIFV